MKKLIFIDRDGTLIDEPTDNYQVDSLEKLRFKPFVISSLKEILHGTGYELVMVTNQDGLGSPSFPEEDFWPAHNKMLEIFRNEGIEFKAIHIDKSLPADPSPNRKPGTGMLTDYMKGNYDLHNSYVIGDRTTDMELAQNLGAKGIFLSDQLYDKAILCTPDWQEIRDFLVKRPRKSIIERKTSETDIYLELNVDGSGKFEIQTGIGFFDHMLEQIARHGTFDVFVKTLGDLHVDEHHTIEDTGIALGMAFNQCLENKRGIERYGFTIPMDDALAQVAVDFGGRPWIEWHAGFKREKIGDFPTEMFYHFFKSFSDQAKCNLHIRAEGDNEHHKIESIFKAFARAIKMAVKRNPEETGTLPTTKGAL
jgi:imidazoleglycerol-phosphate dehydratase/histidinol-phosphatase